MPRIAQASKYNNRRTEREGITFASKREADRYQELRLAEKAGEIRNLSIQQEYPLVTIDDPDSRKAKTHQVSTYVADFVYEEKVDYGYFARWEEVVEDCKGHRTTLYRLKKKWMLLQYNITIRET